MSCESPPLPMDKLSVSVREAAMLLSVCESTVVAAVRTGRLKCCRFGRKIVIPVESLRAMLAGEGSRLESPPAAA